MPITQMWRWLQISRTYIINRADHLPIIPALRRENKRPLWRDGCLHCGIGQLWFSERALLKKVENNKNNAWYILAPPCPDTPTDIDKRKVLVRNKNGLTGRHINWLAAKLHGLSSIPVYHPHGRKRNCLLQAALWPTHTKQNKKKSKHKEINRGH